jgi:recombination associated protein RdgC
MDMADILNSKLFLGQEFLTWLWYLCEEQGSVILEDGREVSLFMDELLVLGPAQGQDGNRVTVRGKEASLVEAKEGLKTGKLVEKMRLGMILGTDEFFFTIAASDLTISSLKTPPSPPGEASQDMDGQRLERIYLIDQVVSVIDELFGFFLSARLEDENGGELWQGVIAWANSKEPGSKTDPAA